jgi:cell division protein FtsB
MFGLSRSRGAKGGPSRTKAGSTQASSTRAGSSSRTPVPLAERARHVALAGIFVAMIVALGSLAAAPARAWWDQQGQIADAEARLAELDRATTANAARLAALESDSELERLARRDFGLAKPGEEVYVVLPPPADLPEVPKGWPFDQLGLRLATR